MHGLLFCAADQRVEVATLNALRLYSAVLSLHPALYRSSERCFSACSFQTDVTLEARGTVTDHLRSHRKKCESVMKHIYSYMTTVDLCLPVSAIVYMIRSCSASKQDTASRGNTSQSPCEVCEFLAGLGPLLGRSGPRLGQCPVCCLAVPSRPSVGALCALWLCSLCDRTHFEALPSGCSLSVWRCFSACVRLSEHDFVILLSPRVPEPAQNHPDRSTTSRTQHNVMRLPLPGGRPFDRDCYP